MDEPNPRAVVGGNAPPSMIILAEPAIAELRTFLNDYPVVTNEDEARTAKAIYDRVAISLSEVEKERDGKVRPLNQQVDEINGDYHKFHNRNDKKPGLWDTLVKELKIRLSNFAKAEERKRIAAAEAARKAAEEAERKAREAEAAERKAQEEAAQGVCDTDFAQATEQADTAFADYERASRFAQRAERDTKVRLVGGIGNAISLRETETLHVADWKAAIEEMGLTDDIRDAILKSARAYRKAFRELPAGITATYERGL